MGKLLNTKNSRSLLRSQGRGVHRVEERIKLRYKKSFASCEF